MQERGRRWTPENKLEVLGLVYRGDDTSTRYEGVYPFLDRKHNGSKTCIEKRASRALL